MVGYSEEAMCGRFARKSTQEVLAEWFGLELEEMPWFAPTYNAAPQSIQPVIRLNRDSGKREVALMRRGLVPFWARDAKVGLSTINARAEEAAGGAQEAPLPGVRGCVL
jgi:putative SOS response-associated peptidase YedK